MMLTSRTRQLLTHLTLAVLVTLTGLGLDAGSSDAAAPPGATRKKIVARTPQKATSSTTLKKNPAGSTKITTGKKAATRKKATSHGARRSRRGRRAAQPVIIVDKTLPTRMAEARLKVSTVRTTKASADSTRVWVNDMQPHDPHYALFVLPGQELQLRAHVAGGLAQRWEGEGTFAPAAVTPLPAPRVRTGKAARRAATAWEPTGRAFTWRAPQTSGPTTLILKSATPKGAWTEVARLNIEVMLPADKLVAGRLGGYLIGHYPLPRDMADSVYMPPIAFLRAASSGRATRISPSFFLEDFACHAETNGDDRYVALAPRLLPFLEAISNKVLDMTGDGFTDPLAPDLRPMASVTSEPPAATPRAKKEKPQDRNKKKGSSLPAPSFTGALAAAASNLAGAATALVGPAAPTSVSAATRDTTLSMSAPTQEFSAPPQPMEPAFDYPPERIPNPDDDSTPGFATSPNISPVLAEALTPAGSRLTERSTTPTTRAPRRAPGGEGGVAPLPLTAEMREVVQQRPIKVLSGYRTPAYNRALNTARLSRHQYGDASDIYVDMDNDGRMDDLNRDGVIDGRDAMTLAAWIEDLWQRSEFRNCPGGLGIYNGTGAHGPFVHVDMRGSKARWGGNGLRWDNDNVTARELLGGYRSALPPIEDYDSGDTEPEGR